MSTRALLTHALHGAIGELASFNYAYFVTGLSGAPVYALTQSQWELTALPPPLHGRIDVLTLSGFTLAQISLLDA